MQQWENRARQRAATWFYPDSSEPVTKGQIVLKIGDHDKSGSEQRGSRTSSLYCVCLSVCLSVRLCNYLALCADLALRIKKYPRWTGGAAHGQELHYAVSLHVCVSATH